MTPFICARRSCGNLYDPEVLHIVVMSDLYDPEVLRIAVMSDLYTPNQVHMNRQR